MFKCFRSKILKLLFICLLLPVSRSAQAGELLNAFLYSLCGSVGLLTTYFTVLVCKKCKICPEKSNFVKRPKPTIKKFSQAPTFEQWKLECEKLPRYEDARSRDRYKYTTLKGCEFKRAIKALIDVSGVLRKSSFVDSACWVDGKAPSDEYFNCNVDLDDLKEPPGGFVQKIVTDADTRTYVHADLHADIQSLNEYLQELYQEGAFDNNFKITDPNTYLVFLGDYSDRGYYGAEVIYTLARLKAANPDNVILLRGNHESLQINIQYGLIGDVSHRGTPGELQVKFGLKKDELSDMAGIINAFYNLLPSAVYLGAAPETEGDYTDYALLCHGGLEPRFNPKGLLADKRKVLYQWINDLNIDWLYKELSRKLERLRDVGKVDVLGFRWNDFDMLADSMKFNASRGAGYIFGKTITNELFKACSSEKNKYRVTCMLRGHQHGEEMMDRMKEHHGLYNAWSENQWSGKEGDVVSFKGQTPVWTLNTSPCSVYGQGYGYDYDTYAILKMNGTHDNWQLEPHNIKKLLSDFC